VIGGFFAFNLAQIPGALPVSVIVSFCAHAARAAKRQTNVTVSIGVADVAGNRRKPDDLVKAADKALYQAKSYGRNCTVVGEA
jgi:diguanylate cyclase (GGDEF)-like protein